jgi:hypothetical protein
MVGLYIFAFVIIGGVLNPMDFWEGLFVGYLITVLWLVFMYWLVSKCGTGNEPMPVSKYNLSSDPEEPQNQ